MLRIVTSLLPLGSGAMLLACRPAPSVVQLGAVAIEATLLPQTATSKEPLFLLRCSGGSAASHYKWQLGAGLRPMPSTVDAPTLLVAKTRPSAAELEARCTIRDGLDASVPTGAPGKPDPKAPPKPELKGAAPARTAMIVVGEARP